jgi:hypothetical protein
MAFAKLKALLRKAAERTVDRLWTVVGALLDAFTLAVQSRSVVASV